MFRFDSQWERTIRCDENGLFWVEMERRLTWDRCIYNDEAHFIDNEFYSVNDLLMHLLEVQLLSVSIDHEAFIHYADMSIWKPWTSKDDEVMQKRCYDIIRESMSFIYELMKVTPASQKRWNDITWESTSLTHVHPFSWTIWPPLPKTWNVENHDDKEIK